MWDRWVCAMFFVCVAMATLKTVQGRCGDAYGRYYKVPNHLDNRRYTVHLWGMKFRQVCPWGKVFDESKCGCRFGTSEIAHPVMEAGHMSGGSAPSEDISHPGGDAYGRYYKVPNHLDNRRYTVHLWGMKFRQVCPWGKVFDESKCGCRFGTSEIAQPVMEAGHMSGGSAPSEAISHTDSWCSERPNGFNITQYYIGCLGEDFTRSCDPGYVYNQEVCNCVRQPNCSKREVSDNSDWMKDLPDQKQNIPLNGIAIPGTHNSATGHMTSSSKVAPDNDKVHSLTLAWKSNVAKITKLLGPYPVVPGAVTELTGHAYGEVRAIIRRWSQTQELTITEQLTAGVRYFDLRVAYNKEDGDFHLVHGLYSVTVSSAMYEMKTFLDAHSHEVVILDFNHFYKMNSSEHVRLSGILRTRFGSKLCPVTPMPTLTLSYMWGKGKQVLLFYHDTTTTENNIFWPPSRIKSPWANTANITDLITYLEVNHVNNDTSNFLVSQGLLTPTNENILGGASSSLKYKLAIPTLEVYLPWLKNKLPSPAITSIFMADFVEECDFIRSVIRLNLMDEE